MRRTATWFWLLSLLTVTLALACLVTGAVDIPLRDVVGALTGGEVERETWRVIVTDSRVPMIITAALAGAALSIAGLLLQTTFNNPLCGPSILGVSTGASLGVAIVMLSAGGTVIGSLGMRIGALIGALTGAMTVMLLLLLFSRMLRSSTMLLIVGIMVSYFASSGISLLNFFSTQQGVHSYTIWGLGNFSGVTPGDMPLYSAVIILSIASSLLMIKPLNAMLLGDRYATNLGVGVYRVRNMLLVISGLLTALVTAFCGPIGFIGIIVPHIARLIFRTAHHGVLLPATALCGAAIALLCTLLSVLPANGGVIPINAITPVIGAPVILYIIIYRNKLYYFN